MLSTFISGISAGVLIAIGGTVFLSCDSRYAGALLFAVALLCICWKGYYLFTGKIGYVTEDHSAENVLRLVVGLAANLMTTLLLGLLLRYALPNIGSVAEGLCAAKLFADAHPCVLLRHTDVSGSQHLSGAENGAGHCVLHSCVYPERL